MGQTPPPPSPPVRVPPQEVERRRGPHGWDTDKLFMLVGAATFAATYGIPLAFLARFGSCDHGDAGNSNPEVDRCEAAERRYLVPVVGPWLAYKEDSADASPDPKVAIVWGSAQLFGIAVFLIGATGTSQYFNVARRGHASLNVAPVTTRDWAGVGLNGSF